MPGLLVVLLLLLRSCILDVDKVAKLAVHSPTFSTSVNVPKSVLSKWEVPLRIHAFIRDSWLVRVFSYAYALYSLAACATRMDSRYGILIGTIIKDSRKRSFCAVFKTWLCMFTLVAHIFPLNNRIVRPATLICSTRKKEQQPYRLMKEPKMDLSNNILRWVRGSRVCAKDKFVE